MKKSLTINATRNGKKVSKSLGFVNPDVANSIVGGFAQMVNALSNDTFVNAEVVKKMDTTEEEQGGTTPAPAGKQEAVITVLDGDNNPVAYDSCDSWGGTFRVSYNGDAQQLRYAATQNEFGTLPASGGTFSVGDLAAVCIVAPPTDNFTSAGFFFTTRD